MLECIFCTISPGSVSKPVPRWVEIGSPASLITENSGSQCSSWIGGNPTLCGVMLNDTEHAPRLIARSASCAASLPSHIGMSATSMIRPGIAAANSSMIQSL